MYIRIWSEKQTPALNAISTNGQTHKNICKLKQNSLILESFPAVPALIYHTSLNIIAPPIY